MSFWSVMNWIAWGACALITLLLVKDVIAVETGRFESRQERSSRETPNQSEG